MDLKGYKAKLFRAYSQIMQMDEMEPTLEKMLNMAMQQRLSIMTEMEATDLYTKIRKIFDDKQVVQQIRNPLI